ncbi:MAG TPA: DUF996 domain-containing protein [Proteobacteria bacterium]|nr:DUF996 domain-containing protein [Pseudomonadota bacterium]
MRNLTCKLGGIGYMLFSLGVLLFVFLPERLKGFCILLMLLASVPVVIANLMAAKDLNLPKVRTLTILAVVIVVISFFFATVRGGASLPDVISLKVQADEPAGEGSVQGGSEPKSAAEAAGESSGEPAEPSGGEQPAAEPQPTEPAQKPEGAASGMTRRSVIISALVAWILGMIAASMWFEIYKAIAAQTGIRQFRSGGLLVFLGSVLLIAIAGVVLCEAGYIMLALAFLKAGA